MLTVDKCILYAATSAHLTSPEVTMCDLKHTHGLTDRKEALWTRTVKTPERQTSGRRDVLLSLAAGGGREGGVHTCLHLHRDAARHMCVFWVCDGGTLFSIPMEPCLLAHILKVKIRQ